MELCSNEIQFDVLFSLYLYFVTHSIYHEAVINPEFLSISRVHKISNGKTRQIRNVYVN